MTDLKSLFMATEPSDFMHLCAAVYSTAHKDFLGGVAAKPDHWLFNHAAVMRLRMSRVAQQTDTMSKPIEGCPLFTLPIVIDYQDRSETPRFEVILKPQSR